MDARECRNSFIHFSNEYSLTKYYYILCTKRHMTLRVSFWSIWEAKTSENIQMLAKISLMGSCKLLVVLWVLKRRWQECDQECFVKFFESEILRILELDMILEIF